MMFQPRNQFEEIDLSKKSNIPLETNHIEPFLCRFSLERPAIRFHRTKRHADELETDTVDKEEGLLLVCHYQSQHPEV